MKRSRLIFVTSLLMTLCAGVVLGAVWAKLPVVHGQPVVTPTGTPSRGWLDDQLHLRPEQRVQMQAIWDELHQKMGKNFERRRAIDKERDEAQRALLTEEQRAKWDEIRTQYRARADEEAPVRSDQLFRDADARSRAILDEEQQKKWDELKKQRDERGHRRGPGGSGGGHGPSRSSSTQRGPGYNGPGGDGAPPRLDVSNPEQPRP